MEQEKLDELAMLDFEAALDEFFEICFEKAKAGEMPYSQVERFIEIIDDQNKERDPCV